MGNRAPNGANKAPNRANWVPKWGKTGTLASLQLETWIFLTKITLKWKVFGNQHSPKILVSGKWVIGSQNGVKLVRWPPCSSNLKFS